MVFILKTVTAGVLIAWTSWLAGKKPVLAGFIIALPITSMIALAFSYAEFRDMQKVNDFAASILTAVPLSLVFFLPFLLNRWLKMGFFLTFVLGVLCVVLTYGLYDHFTRALR